MTEGRTKMRSRSIHAAATAAFLFLLPGLSLASEEQDLAAGARMKREEGGSPALREEQDKGPEKFVDANFLLQVDKGIVVHVFDAANTSARLDTIVLNKAAVSVKGSQITEKAFSETIDWKDQTFQGKAGQLESMLLILTFNETSTEYRLTQISAKLRYNNVKMGSVKLKTNTLYGYKVSAPLGLAFCCDDPGMFPPDDVKNEQYSIGITFPGMKAQVFNLNEDTFGARWDCREVLSIGMWVGLLVTIFFALVCYWGFGMLANIQTMDRFDDPKGKPIHVPQNE